MSLLGDIFGFIGTGRAAKSISDADIAAEHGVLNANTTGQQGVNDALQNAEVKLSNAGDKAIGAVNDATDSANMSLAKFLELIKNGNSPYVTSGMTGLEGLTDLLKGDKFSFRPEDFFNSDAYKFQLAQGQDAIQNRASAMGISSSGNTLKDLTTFGQGLASTYYKDAFDRAKSTFETNRDTTLSAALPLVQAGEFGVKENNTATESFGGQIAKNTLANGYYAGDTNLSLADLLARLQTQGAQFNANLGLNAAKTAGDYAVNAGTAHAGGILGQTGALTGLIGDAAGLLSPLAGSIPLGAGKATTLAGIFGGGKP